MSDGPTREEIQLVATLIAWHAILSRPASAGVFPAKLVEDAIDAAAEFVKKVVP